jgi:hypothetical protein
MDVVMSPEEKAEMEAAAEEEKAATASASNPAASPATATAAPTADATHPNPSVAAEKSETSLAHHSSFSAQPSSSGSSSDLAKKHEHGKDVKKTKPKLTPEQKAQLDALEKKKDEERKARWVVKLLFVLI